MDESTLRNPLRVGSCNTDLRAPEDEWQRAGWLQVAMSSQFVQDVEQILGSMMRDLGFNLDEVDDGPDEGGIERHIVYYSSAMCKIQVYYSSREGEVNSMIAPPDVPNSFGLTAPKWLHITKFTKRPDLPFKDLLRRAREEYASYPNPISWVRACIEENFEAALAGVIKSSYSSEIAHHLGEALAQKGFTVNEVNDCIDYGEGAAGAVFYTAFDCKLQICWSSRQGSFDFMLSQIDAPNELGLSNRSKKWHFISMLDDSEDGLITPSIHADTEVWWEWRRALFEAHIDGAREALRQRQT